jgi:mevalonate kinase
MTRCSAPGKAILFGEHAVVFGKPALALAINLRIMSGVTKSSGYSVNGHPMKKKHHAYVSASLDEAWNGPPIDIETSSEIPSGSGLGSSAAVTVSCIAAMLAEKEKFEFESIARKAFEVESRVQGRASPIDTSTSTHGYGVLVSPDKLDNFLWRIEKSNTQWNIHHCEVPKLSFVVGYTGIHAATGPLVAKVKKFVDSDDKAARMISRIGEIVIEGVDAIKRGAKQKVGALMTENHQILNELGVGHPALDKLVDACNGISYGAKLTGAGGGGSMICLTDDVDQVSKAIARAGGEPIVVRVGCEGVRMEATGVRTR